MPLIRIDLRKGKDAIYRREVGRVVYEAMVGAGVPANDRFQIIGEHEADSFVFDPDYLGIHRTDDLVIIQITWNEGRSVDQKKALYKTIADGLSAILGIRPEERLHQHCRGEEGELVLRQRHRTVRFLTGRRGAAPPCLCDKGDCSYRPPQARRFRPAPCRRRTSRSGRSCSPNRWT